MNSRTKFTKIDLSQAYNQIMLDEDSKNLTTINTHKGLYRWSHLLYGVPLIKSSHFSRYHGYDFS